MPLYIIVRVYVSKNWDEYKAGCVFTMVIWSEFRMRKYRDGDHREDAPHFNISREILKNNKTMFLEMIPAALFSDHFLIISGK